MFFLCQMETLDANIATGNPNSGSVEMEGLKHRVDELMSKVDKASIISDSMLNC